MTEHLMRMCDVCGKVDDHPRHVHAGTGDQQTPLDVFEKAYATPGLSEEVRLDLLRHYRDDSTRVAHIDCCAAEGCPDEVVDPDTGQTFRACDEVVAVVRKGKGKFVKGNALRRHIEAGHVDHLGKKFQEHRLKAHEMAQGEQS